MSVEQGLDPQKIKDIASQLDVQGERVEAVHDSGNALVAALEESWAGPDLDDFHRGWQDSTSQLNAMATALRAAGKELQQQAEQQMRASDDLGSGPPGGRPGADVQVPKTFPWDELTDFGRGLLVADEDMIDTVRDAADWTGDRVRDGADRVNEGMDWLDDRVDDARDWAGDRADDLGDLVQRWTSQLRVAADLLGRFAKDVIGATGEAIAQVLFTGVSGTVAGGLLDFATRQGWVDDGRGVAGEEVELSTEKSVKDQQGDRHRQIRQPTSLDEIMRSTSDAYGNDGNVRITEITRPDGSSAYIVNTPGTQPWTPGTSNNPLDLLGNLGSVSGDSTAASEAVWDAMDKADIPPDAPVLMAGHSQGGMINQGLLADPEFVERFNVTHSLTYGSPVDSIPDTSGVRQLHLHHKDDAVPQTDMGNAPKPSRLGDDATVVELDNPPGVYEKSVGERLGIGQPLMPPGDSSGGGDWEGAQKDVIDAHSHKLYADSVKSSSDPALREFENDLDDFVVPRGERSDVSGVDIKIKREK